MEFCLTIKQSVMTKFKQFSSSKSKFMPCKGAYLLKMQVASDSEEEGD